MRQFRKIWLFILRALEGFKYSGFQIWSLGNDSKEIVFKKGIKTKTAATCVTAVFSRLMCALVTSYTYTDTYTQVSSPYRKKFKLF